MKRRINLALRFCITAWLVICCVLLLVGMLVCFAMALIKSDMRWLIAGAVSGALCGVGFFAFHVEAPMVRCLMCGAEMLRPLQCSRHKNARRWLGSTTLRSTLKLAVFPKSFDCPYCDGHYKLSSEGRIRRTSHRAS